MLKKTLVQCARAGARKKNSYFQTMYGRIAARRGANIAAVAVARMILEIYYHMVRDGACYEDLGADYFDERNKRHVLRKAIKRIEGLGYSVSIEEAAC